MTLLFKVLVLTWIKDVRAQNVSTYRFFLNLGGHRARFRDHEVHFYMSTEACAILRRSLLTTVSNKKATSVKFRSGKRTQFNITNITKQTFVADVFF